MSQLANTLPSQRPSSRTQMHALRNALQGYDCSIAERHLHNLVTEHMSQRTRERKCGCKASLLSMTQRSEVFICLCVCVFARLCHNLQRNLTFLRVLLSADSADISTNCLEECPGAGDGHPAHPYAHLHHFAFESSHTCVLARRGRIKPLFDICL